MEDWVHEGIETYPVGLFNDLKRRRINVSYLKRQISHRNWRAIKNYFNGYLAEWNYCPNGVNHSRCGSGWTRKRALDSLGKHLVQSNLSTYERSRRKA